MILSFIPYFTVVHEQKVNNNHITIIIQGLVDWTWTEEYSRAKLFLYTQEAFEYTLQITEDFNDGRFHEENTLPKTKSWRVNQLAHLFFGTCGSLLKINSNAPALVLKIESKSSSGNVNVSGTPSQNQPSEWFAVQVYDSNHYSDTSDTSSNDSEISNVIESNTVSDPSALCVLEYIIRLASLEYMKKTQHTDINDEFISLFMSNETKENTSTPVHKETPRRNQSKVMESPLLNRSMRQPFIDRLKSNE